MGITARDVDRDTWAKLQAAAGAQGTPTPARRSAGPSRGRAKPVPLVPPSVRRVGAATVFTVPLRVYAGDNLSGTRSKARIGRAGHERRATAAVLADGLRALAACRDRLLANGAVSLTLTRLGGRTMDTSNVVAALKYVQDTCALFLGVDDAHPGLDWRYGQEASGAYGVRIKLEKA